MANRTTRRSLGKPSGTALSNAHPKRHLPTPPPSTQSPDGDGQSLNDEIVKADTESTSRGRRISARDFKQEDIEEKENADAGLKTETDDNEEPHGLGKIPQEPEDAEQLDTKIALEDNSSELDNDEESTTKSKKPKAPSVRQSAAKAAKEAKDAERAVTQLATVKARIAADAEKRAKAIESGKKSKSETYGLCEGETPYPRWTRPSPEECDEVYEILHKKHPECRPQPATIPEPSQFVAGCGEVRSILDALIRTRLSASTTGRNSSAAYQGMVKRYGILQSGVGKGSVNYNAIRLAPVQDLYHAIKVGGLAVNKGADIKAILDLVYEENQARRRELLDSKVKTVNKAQRDAEIKLADDENLSLDHCYTLPTYEAIYKFMTYPGIGVKTAACVAMFCMQRPCFAVDTHVFRLAKWLGWVPPAEEKVKGEKPVDRDTTFSHLEVRIPDKHKYMLHQLFIKHGKTCPRCRGITGEGSANWSKGCVIDHLVQRSGPRKGGILQSPAKANGKSPKSAKKSLVKDESDESLDEIDQKVADIDESEESEEMPELNDDDDEDDSESDSLSDDDDEFEERKVGKPHSNARKQRNGSKSPKVPTPVSQKKSSISTRTTPKRKAATPVKDMASAGTKRRKTR